VHAGGAPKEKVPRDVRRGKRGHGTARAEIQRARVHDSKPFVQSRSAKASRDGS
jgi:hypothetical protein